MNAVSCMHLVESYYNRTFKRVVSVNESTFKLVTAEMRKRCKDQTETEKVQALIAQLTSENLAKPEEKLLQSKIGKLPDDWVTRDTESKRAYLTVKGALVPRVSESKSPSVAISTSTVTHVLRHGGAAHMALEEQQRAGTTMAVGSEEQDSSPMARVAGAKSQRNSVDYTEFDDYFNDDDGF